MKQGILIHLLCNLPFVMDNL
uniref:Uncharacterized protein n=1 Tax=Arundo donax TaxID=35708 RepID=A0A0A9ELZ8_ARUDO